MKPNPKRPQLWIQASHEKYFERLRILYPDGKAEWMWSGHGYYDWHYPCFLKPHSISSIKQTLKLMRKYDKDNLFPPAEFLGNL